MFFLVQRNVLHQDIFADQLVDDRIVEQQQISVNDGENSQVKVIAKAAGLADWEFFSGHSGRVGMARRMAQNGAPTHEIERQGRWKQGGGMVGRYTRGESAGSALKYL